MDKLERLLNLTATLLDTERALTADEIRELVPGYPDNPASFRRAFERDKDDLREMGIPIRLEPVHGEERPIDGYRIHRSEYYLADPGLEPDELAALNLALRAVRLDGIQGVEALWKLGGAVEVEGPASEVASLPSEPALVPLFGAILDCRTATFEYRSSERTATRTIDPYRLDYRRGHWYVTGLDHLTGQRRQFRLDRIIGQVQAGEPGEFERPADVAFEDSQPWELGEGEPVTVRLLVDEPQAVWAARQLGDEAMVERRDDGSAVFEVDVVNWPAFRGLALSYLDHAEVLEPAELRDDVVAWLEAIEAR